MIHKSIHDADALLLYRVGPVYCCSPTFPVESVMMPPHMAHPPGTSVAEPGVFKTAQGIVKAVDLRKRFGVDEKDWTTPGRIVIVEVEGGFAGIWVDEIVDVIQSPSKGWGEVPACIPKDVFSRTLLLNDVIQLYADFENIYNFREVGYLRQHIENLKAAENKKILEEDKAHSQLLDKKHFTISNNEKDKAEAEAEASKPGQAKRSADEQYKTEVVENRRNDVHKQIELPTSKSSPREPEKEISYNKISSAKDRHVTHVDLKRDKSGLINAVQDMHSADIESKRLSAAGMTNIEAKNKPNSLDSKTAEVGSSAGSSYAPQVSREIESSFHDSNEPSYFLYIIVSVVVIVLGAYVINMMTSSFEEPNYLVVSNEKKKDSISSKNIDEGESIIEIKKTEPYKPILDESRGLNLKEAYHADIKKDKEGLVIVLSQPVEDDVVSEEKLNEPEENEALDPKGSKKIATVGPDVTKEEIAGDEIKLEKESVILKATKNTGLIRDKVIIHMVVKGDTLWHIARRYINNPFRYPELAKLSHIKNPDLIYPGDKVKIIYKNGSK